MNSNNFNNKFNIVQVAVPNKLNRVLDYLIPENIKCNTIKVGIRVLVPLRTTQVIGIILGINNHSSCESDQLKYLIQVLDSEPIFSDKSMQLLTWCAKYYHYPIGLIFATALPAYLKKPENDLYKVVSTWEASYFCKQQNKSKTQTPNSNQLAHIKANITLNKFQLAAIEQIKQNYLSQQFKVFVLNGITGSGKTEVYLQLIQHVIAKDQQALILIPEIGLAPQIVQKVFNIFNVPIVYWHSKLTIKQRFEAWSLAKNNIAKIIIGTRSAVFIYLAKPGLFIMDEEHDLSFKQQNDWRYLAKDVLIKRGEYENCTIVLGSATPTLETIYNVSKNKYAQLMLPHRAGIAVQPEIAIIDIRQKKLQAGLSEKLLILVEQHLQLKHQIMLFINRRGYAPTLLCLHCGWHQVCINCAANMIVHIQHNKNNKLYCHYCNRQQAMPVCCPKCQNNNLQALGLGTQKVEAKLQEYFSQANIARIDRDTTSKTGSLEKLLANVTAGKSDIIIGTQMLAKGHHFPNLNLVAILDLDRALFSADFRSIERMGQMLTQVSGRSGRGSTKGQVVIQTMHPHHPSLLQMLSHNYNLFSQTLLEERKKINLPPFSYQALFGAEHKKLSKILDFLNKLKQKILQSDYNKQHNTINILGPVPAPLERKLGYYRGQLLLQLNNRSILHKILDYVVKYIEYNKIAQNIKWSLDLDPQDLF